MRFSNATQGVAALIAAVSLVAGAANAATVEKERSTKVESTPSGTTTTTTSRMYSKSDSPDVVYKSLDPDNRGYVMRKETTERISGFGPAFDKADAKHNGRLTREEFNSAWTVYKSTD
jgi:hypothetical protein